MELFSYDFMRNAILAGLLAAIATGIVGVYVVVKKMVFIGGGISHASFGGIGLGYFLGINPIFGALFFSLAAAISMGFITRKTKLPEDTVIGILWAIGMALGIIFIGLTPGYVPDLFSYLFGNILTVPQNDLMFMLILDIILVLLVIMLYKGFLSITFDEEYAAVAGVPVEILYIVLLCMIALTIVVLIRVVGIILVIALLSVPAALAKQFTCDLKKMMLLAILFGAIFTFGGLWISFILDLASGATIILLSGFVLLTNFGIDRLLSRKES